MGTLSREAGRRMEELSKRDVNRAIRRRMAGRSLLSNFFTKPPEKEALIKGAIADVVLDKMSDLLVRTTYEVGIAHGLNNDESAFKPFLEMQGKITIAIELVRLGYDPEGTDRVSDPIVQDAAKVTDTACYFATITGKFDAQHVAAQFRRLLGYP